MNPEQAAAAVAYMMSRGAVFTQLKEVGCSVIVRNGVPHFRARDMKAGLTYLLNTVTYEVSEDFAPPAPVKVEVKAPAPKRKLTIEDQFSYHPPTTEARKAKHEEVNKAAMEFAKLVDERVCDGGLKRKAIEMIQMARMFANQGITYDELRGVK